MNQYNNFVSKGKAIVVKLNELKKQQVAYQYKIAQYATEVCEIKHGGISTGRYTIKKYAQDIGLNPKTVQYWVEIYRHVAHKIELENPTPKEWSKASKVNKILKLDRSIENKKNGTPNTRNAYKKEIPQETVKNIYNALDEKPFVGECHSMTVELQNSKKILNQNKNLLNSLNPFDVDKVELNIKNCKNILTKRDLSIVSDDRLILIMQLMDECSDIINNYLTSKIRFKVG